MKKMYLRCYWSVAQSRRTLCDPMHCSTPGLPVLHYCPKFAQTHVHGVCDAIQASHALLSPSPPAFPSIKGFFNESALHIRCQNIGASASALVLPMNIHGWFPLWLSSLISLQSKELSRVFSSTTVWKHQFFGTQPSLWSSSHIHTWLLEKPQLWLHGHLLAK